MDAEDMRFADSIGRRVHLHAYTRCSLRLIAQKSRLHLLMNQPAATRFYYCRRAILYVSSRKHSNCTGNKVTGRCAIIFTKVIL